MSERVPRLTLVFAVITALLTGLGSSAQVGDPPIAPYDEEATQAELDFWSETFACPELAGLERRPEGDSVSVGSSTGDSRRCNYLAPDNTRHTLEIRFDKSDDPFDSYCYDSEDSRDDLNIRIHTVGRTHSMQGVYPAGQDALAFEPVFEAAIRSWMTAGAPFVRVCPEAPIAISCPPLNGREASETEPDELGPDTYVLRCLYPADDAHPSSVTITLWWVAPNTLSDLISRTCGDQEYARNGVGLVSAEGKAVLAFYVIASPLEEDDEAGIVAIARDLVAAAEVQAISCDGVDVSGAVDPFSELPGYLAPAFADEFIAVAPGSISGGPGDGGGAPDIFGSDPVATTPGATAGTGAGTLSRVLTIGMLAFSLLGLIVTFLLVRRETKVRPGRDIFRVVVTGAVATLMVVVFSRGAPLWAVAAGVGAGLALGAWQGSNLTVRLTDRGLYAKRGTLAIVAFAAGIAVSQVAGLLNRTGALTIGITMSFLSAALTVGLILGRSPRIAEARISGPATGLFLVVVLVLAGLVAAVPGQAQEASQTVERPAGTCNYFLSAPSGPGSDESRCDGHRLMIDLVDWDRVGVAGGLFWTGRKPFTEIAVPRALDEPPQPLTQTIEWTNEDGSSVYQVTETFEFSLREDGKCCSVAYEGSGAETVTRSNGEVVVTSREATGRLHDIQPVGVSLNGPFARSAAAVPIGTPFSEVTLFTGQPEDACIRLVAEPVSSNRQEGAWDTYLLDGEPQNGDFQLTMAMVIGCDLPGFTYEAALAAAPASPSGDDPARGGCPVRQELHRELIAISGLDGVATKTVSDLFLRPNEPVCIGGGDFGEGGRGGTRHEISVAFQADDPIAWSRTVVLFEENWFFFFRPDRIPADQRCEVDADGIPIRPPGDEGCEVISMHLIPLPSSISGIRQSGSSGMVWMRTDYFSDGPNVNIRALLRGVEYRYRCHHCLPGDPRITDFLKGLHGFSSRTRIEITGPPAPVVARPATPVAGAPPDAAPATDDGDLSEDAATVALIGLLGSAALLAAALVETGLNTPAELLAAIRRGDLLAPPELLDEDDEPLFVNDGSYPEAPVGHVWWGIDEDEGRWVSPAEAQDLVTEARAAGAALEQDRADAYDRMMDQADEDWKTLIRTTRAQTAAAEMEAAMAGERRAVLDAETHNAWVNAINRGQMDLVDFIDRNESLTADQIQQIYDSIHRREADEAALAAIPEINVYIETAKITQEQFATALDKQGSPILAWAVRHPEVVLRVAAAVATDGASELVFVPLQITSELHEAQERSLRENGRMMSSDELFGELGWAVGREAVYEAGGRLAAHGIGRIFSSGDEVAEAALRQGDEALPAARRTVTEVTEDLSEAASREASELAGRVTRSGDETLEGAARQLDEAGEPMRGVPPKGNEAIRELETGARIPDELAPQTGLTRGHIDELQTYTRNNDLNVTGRATNPYSAEHLANGTAVRKPLDIKIKTGNDLDVLLGANARDRGVVTLFEPKMPKTAGMSDELIDALKSRRKERIKEWNDYKDAWVARGERTMSFGGTTRPQRLMNGRLEVMVDGQWKSIAGDFDLVNITRADGTPLSAVEFNRHVDEMVQRGLIEHGGEVRLMTDIMRNNPHPPGTKAWLEEAAEVWRLRNKLENAYAEGEFVLGIHATEGLHRAADPDLLRWQGGFEGADGRLIEFGSPPDLSGAAPGILRGLTDDDTERP